MTQFKHIECKNLSVKYNSEFVLQNINFEIKFGEIFFIAGRSGCGKSTLLRQIIGIETPYEGDIFVEGEDLINSHSQKREAILRKFGVMFQSGGLLASLTIGENIELVLEKFTNLSFEQIKELSILKLALVGLAEFYDYYPAEISGGMKKRAAIARALALDPSILCLDEPSSGLDPVTSASLDLLIKELNKALKTTVIVVSHDLSSILNIADRVLVLDRDIRGIAAVGSPADLKKRQDDEKIYKFFNRLP
ncbi:MAG: ATP-binding cassette domain-containing protein [Candidatus Kapabacteria bacterium]|nr:ATP-binding cassette domain-containing protein [Candidatus Kapabacteria bacterium]